VCDLFRSKLHTTTHFYLSLHTERTIDKGLNPKDVNPKAIHCFGDIVDLHVKGLAEVGKTMGRSKHVVLTP
jgi:hypothetical protein